MQKLDGHYTKDISSIVTAYKNVQPHQASGNASSDWQHQGEDVEELEYSYVAGGNGNWHIHLGTLFDGVS